MTRRCALPVLVGTALLLSFTATAREAPGIAVGTAAPEIKGETWFNTDGKAPDLKDKAYLVNFWFAG